MTTTPTLGLSIYDTASGSVISFLNYRLATSGLSSNMTILDTFAQATSASVSSLRTNSITTVNANRISGNYFEATAAVVTNYNTNMPINLKLDTTISGSATLNINAYGVKSLMKVDTSGSIVQFSTGDLIANRYYLFIYNGTQFVLGGNDSGSAVSSFSGSAPISVSGSSISHNLSGVTSGSYNQIIVDKWGHITAGSFINSGSSSGTSYSGSSPINVAGSVISLNNYGTIWMPDAKPVTSGSYSDEFDDSNLTGWTEFDPDNILASSESAYGLKMVQSLHGAGDSVCGLYKTITDPSFTIYTKFSISGSAFTGLATGGICLYQNPGVSTSDLILAGIETDTNSFPVVKLIWYPDRLTTSASFTLDAYVQPAWTDFYLRFICDNTQDSFTLDYSTLGIGWRRIESLQKSLFFNPVAFGPFINIIDAQDDFSMRYHFMRYKAGVDDFSTPVEGARVRVVR